MLYRVLHTLLMALIVPVAAILILGVVELTAKDDPEDEVPEWARPYLPHHNGGKRRR